jgi:hypothetical protein
MFVIAVLLFLTVEVAAYGMTAWKLYGACGEIMEQMKAENGLNGETRRRFQELINSLNLNEMGVSLEGTPQTVQRGDLLELTARGSYPVRSLRPFGREFSVGLQVRLQGLAHTYIRY